MVRDISARQKSVTKTVTGPPEQVAFDENGNPRIPVLKFAEKLGVDIETVSVKETEKGRYVSATIVEKGLATKTVLKTILPGIILSIPFPKAMRWGCGDISFARPIQWVTALFGGKAVIFKLDGVKSGRYTRGHRFLHPAKINITSPETYIDQLKTASVLCEVDKRRTMINEEIKLAAETINGTVVPDPELLDTVTQLVEYPAVAVGKFDEKFLRLPDEILITAMREHQKYFAVYGKGRQLIPHFIVVNNTPAKDMALVAKGHERVLRARLEDAMFFYDNDLSGALENSVEKLKGVLFQAKLGSMFDKTIRVQKLAEYIADEVGQNAESAPSSLKPNASRAALLCKADLVSQVVVEFPKLQGIMGRIYASKEKEPMDIPMAIEEHYRPTYSGGALPETPTGAVVAIADKMDSICGCFSAGLIPSGASDPYALRRQGIGILQIMMDKGFSFSLSDLIRESLVHYLPDDKEKTDEVYAMVYAFLKDRMTNILVDKGFSKDVVAAVTHISVDCVPDAWQKVAALDTLKQAPDFEPLAVAFKRVVNIIKKSDLDITKDLSAAVNTDLFEDPCETELYQAVREVGTSVSNHMNLGKFEKALLDIATLRDPVDRFFDDVLVMADDERIRHNRLALLGLIAALFENLADFSKLST